MYLLRWAVVAVVLLGASAPGATSMFFFSDPLMGLLALVNLMAVLMLFPVAMRGLEDYRAQLAAGVDKPVFKAGQFPDLDFDRSAWK